MISNDFEEKIWIFFQVNLSQRTRVEYWKIVKDFDKCVGHDPLKLTLKDAKNYYTFLVNRVNNNKISYSTGVMRLSAIRSICDFIENYNNNHGIKYTNYFKEMSLPEKDKMLSEESIPTIKEIDEILKEAKCTNNQTFIILSVIIKCGLTNKEVCELEKEYLYEEADGNICIRFPAKKKIIRTIRLPKDISNLMDKHISDKNITSGAIFFNMHNKRLKTRDLERVMKNICDKLVNEKKLSKNYTVQSLRHAAFSLMLIGGAGKEEVAAYGGITTKWMNRYDKIISSEKIYKACDYSIITINNF